MKKTKILKYIYVIQSCMSKMPENLRLIFRPTETQYKRFQRLLASGKYKHMSELIRHIMEIGMDELEAKYRSN